MKQRPLRIAGIVLAVGVAIGVLAVIGEAQLDGIASSDRTLWVADHLALWVGVALVLLASPALEKVVTISLRKSRSDKG